jgi:LysR family transcriptional regulator, hydrogen peroxide-inducible genes activator
MNISIIQLEYIVALEQHKHFVRAAEACYVTQPTLSMQIRKLEDELGLKLFDRSRQPIVPTDIGKKIIAQAQIILQERARIENIVHDFKETVSGELRIGILPTVSPYLMPPLIRATGDEFPRLKLYVKELTTESIVSMLKKDHLDIGILATPLGDEHILEDPVFYERFKLYLHPEHPAYEKQILNVDDLKKDKIWLLAQGNCFRNQSIRLCSIKFEQTATNLDYESGSLETLKKLVDAEGGATVLPQWAALELNNQDKQHIRSLENDLSVRQISVVYSRNYAKLRSVLAMKKMIRNALPKAIKANEGESVLSIE